MFNDSREEIFNVSYKYINLPRNVDVKTMHHIPYAIFLKNKWSPITMIRDIWIVRDGWWLEERYQVNRIYYEVITENMKLLKVYRDLVFGEWYVY